MPGGIPLPGTDRPVPVPGLLGHWRGIVAAVDPLRVTIIKLTGEDLVPIGETAVFDPPLTVGDRVWVVPVEGRRDDLAVIARRA